LRVTPVFLLFAALSLMRAQFQGVPSSNSTPPGVVGPPTGFPTDDMGMSTSQSPATAAQRPVFVSGTVAMDDGSSLPASVDILSVCGTRQRTVARAASRGGFSFQWNSSEPVLPEAADDGAMTHTSDGSAGTSGSGGLDLVGNCDLRAASSGYTSSRVDLSNGHTSGNFEAGTILLHRLTGNEGRVVSVLALKAPKDVVKNFEKGQALARANKLTEAAASFQKALASYPQYPDAWFALGNVELRLGAREPAREDYRKALDLDGKLVGPWQALGYMASDESKWEEAAKYLDQAVQLDAMGSTMAWYFSAVANYNLMRFDVAERSIRAEIKLNGDRNPRAEFLLAEVLIGREDLKGGAEVLRKYVQTWPHSDDVEAAKTQLSQIESQLALSRP
jgi:tetratricopeptide (TPR) repeat protein